MTVPATDTTTEPSHLQAALDYAARGWAVFPLYGIRERTNPDRSVSRWCECGASGCPAGKHPRTHDGFLSATTDPETIRRWWTDWPSANIGIATGARSNLAVVDVDPRNGGETPAGLPPTLTSLTGGGGIHYLFSGSHKLRSVLCQGVDLKSDAGYIVAPPSLHITGRRYTWDAGQPDDPVPLPDWISERYTAHAGTYVTDPNQEVTETATFAMFQRAGMIKGMQGHGRVNVVCPWEAEHSTGGGADSSTILFPDGGFRCSHGHCTHRKNSDVFAWFKQALPQHYVDPDEHLIQRLKRAMPAMSPEKVAQVKAAHLKRLERENPSAIAKPLDWQSSLVRHPRGGLLPIAGNASLILAHSDGWKGCLAFDELSRRIVWVSDPPRVAGMAAPVTGDILEKWQEPYLQQQLSTQALFSLEAAFSGAVAASRVQSFNPLQAYLRHCESVWDGQPRAESWLSTYLGAQDTPATRAIGSKWLLSAVARAFAPGCQADHVLVLEGQQGCGKSTALRIMGGDYYCPNLPQLDDQKAAAEVLLGRWIVEIGELSSIRGKSAEIVKDFLTRTHDRFRPPYEKSAQDVSRTCVFAGTTNEQQYLDDPTGLRRWWPVRVSRLDRDALTRDRDQIWGEVFTAYMEGRSWHPDEQESAILTGEADDRRELDPWHDKIAVWLKTAHEPTTFDVLTVCLAIEPGRITRNEQMRVAKTLKVLGLQQFRKTDLTGRVVRAWR